jgi:hypothetical protein
MLGTNNKYDLIQYMEEQEYSEIPTDNNIESNPKIAPPEGQTKSNRKDSLRQKQKAFIQFYTEIGEEHFGNGTQCAIKAGYSRRSASAIATDLLQKASIRAAIDLANEERAKSFDWDFDRWQRELIAVFEALTPTHPNKMRAIELIGKAKGFVKDNQIQVNTFNVINDQDITTIRKAVTDRMTKRLTEQPVDKSVDKLCDSSGGVSV